MNKHSFSAGFFFCGLGAGARGFVEASARLGKDEGSFRNLGGIDNDPLSCADFETLTGGPSLCTDLSAMTPADLRAAWGDESPDAIFLSPPCKGFSGLLSKKSAGAEKYQALNRLVLQGMFLACETWSRPPALLVLENVPRITTRGAQLLRQVRQLLAGYGYLFHEATHDCGEIGGLAQHRRRFLLVARLPAACPAYVYRPSKKRVRACGEVLGELPLPQDPRAGELHRLPKLSWLNWVRLALIPAGGDWRDLPGMKPAARAEIALSDSPARHRNKYAVGDWAEPSSTVIGATRPGSGAACVADPRVAMDTKHEPFGHVMKVTAWDEPAGTVTASPAPSSGGGAVADPRLADVVKTNRRANRFTNQYKLRGWSEPAGAVTGDTDVQEGAQNVADPRLAAAFGLARTADAAESYSGRPGLFGVNDWKEPMPTVTASGSVSSSNAVSAVADPRVPRRNGSLGVTRWEGPARTVTGESYPSNGSSSVADPRIGLGRVAFNDSHKVKGWNEPMGAVTTGNKGGVADPRVVDPDDLPMFRGSCGVVPWSEPAPCVRGSSSVRTSKSAVADPRDIPLKCRPWENSGIYGVISWEDAASTVTGSASIDNGRFAIADPRKPPPGDLVPVIIAKDGTWHRPLTTLELAALQGLPHELNGKPLALAGRSVAKWRERIGNAVPVQAARAIAETLLTALLAARLGTWTLGSTGIWVRKDGVTELQANAPYETESISEGL